MSLPALANHFPLDVSNANDTELKARIFYPVDDWTGLVEVTSTTRTESQKFSSVMLGTYYRMIPNLRAGLFYQRQYGFRHDADWIRDPVVEWKWANTNGRGEDLLIFDFSPKLLLSFLPGTNWSFEFKARYEYNFFNRNQSLRLAPTLTYFWIRNGEAFLNFFLQEDQVFPLNYGKKLVNEQWTYLGVLYNYDSQWQAGLYGSRKKQSWVSTDEYEQVEAPYRVTTSGSMIGLLLIYKFASE